MYQVDFNHPIHVYFIGIGGISMSGLAEILLSEGFTVSGSDWNRSALTEHLEKSGAHVNYGKPQKAENITDDIDLVVYTAAVHADNQEFSRAKELQLPMLSRAEFLGQLMKNYDTPIAVSGTHGKTTTTSMISEILLQANTDPTLSIGGILKSIHGNIRVGHSGLFVAEACEYTNSFLNFFPKIGIILNIEEDHLDFFKDLADIRASFRKFAQLLPADGTLFINGDIENWQEITEGLACRVVTFGTTSASDYYSSDISYNKTADATFTVHSLNGQTRQLTLGVPGEHNISNALAAVALSDLLSIDYRDTAAALLNFRGTDRRFEYKGTINGITIVDDYAHHPTELRATLNTAKELGYKRLIAVHQPFTYSRTKMLFNDFVDVLKIPDIAVITPIMGSREPNDPTITSAKLAAQIPGSVLVNSLEEAADWVKQNAREGDLVITLGCGDIYKASKMMVAGNQ